MYPFNSFEFSKTFIFYYKMKNIKTCIYIYIYIYICIFEMYSEIISENFEKMMQELKMNRYKDLSSIISLIIIIILN